MMAPLSQKLEPPANPARFTLTLERIANGWPSRDLDALMPWNYAG
jgi:hypothetical protein